MDCDIIHRKKRLREDDGEDEKIRDGKKLKITKATKVQQLRDIFKKHGLALPKNGKFPNRNPTKADLTKTLKDLGVVDGA